MINQKNFFVQVDKVGIENLPDALRNGVQLILDKTNGKNWGAYAKDKSFKEIVDLTFKKLEEYISFVSSKELSGTKKSTSTDYADIAKEISFIHRLLKLHDQIIYKKTLEIFIHELQQAIKNKEIRKTSPIAKDIVSIQNAVIQAYNSMKSAKHFVLKPATIKRYKTIIEKYENDLALSDGDIEDNKKAKPITLNGIESQTKLMCSTDFAKMQFDTIGFSGKWLKLIGDPCKGFTAMVFGKPKMGKSYLCVDFAGYLARNHGKVLYVAKEEKLDATLQKKLNDKDVVHENLFVSDSLPEDLSMYDYIFLDSVTKLGLTPEAIDKVRAANPGKSFIFIFQSTKEGNFRGDNAYQHDVDAVIEVPEIGKAVQFGRFNQGGEINIFEDENGDYKPEDEGNLEGIQKKSSKKKDDWTEPDWLDEGDHRRLKQIKKYYEEGNFAMAMEVAHDADTVIRDAIPASIWKRMGGQLTKTGEERLRKEKMSLKPIKRIYLPYTFEVVELARIYTEQMGKSAPDIGFYEILADAVETDPELPEQIKELGKSLHKILPKLYNAAKKHQK